MARIMVVDDDPKVSFVVRKILEKNGYEVIWASDGGEALMKLNDERPDLILLDIMMPDMNGWEVCKKIRANKKYSGTLVVMLSVRASGEDMNKSYKCGADAHLFKPFDIEDLLNIVERQLKKAAHSKG